MPGDRRGGDHGRRHYMRPRTAPLAAAEIAIGGRGAALAGRNDIAIDADAHRAAGVRPFEAGIAENTIEPFFLGLPFHLRRARRDQSRDLADAAGEYGGGRAQILDARIGAGADENAVDGDVGQLGAGRNAHIGERILRCIFCAPRRVRVPDRERARRSASRRPAWCPR